MGSTSGNDGILEYCYTEIKKRGELKSDDLKRIRTPHRIQLLYSASDSTELLELLTSVDHLLNRRAASYWGHQRIPMRHFPPLWAFSRLHSSFLHSKVLLERLNLKKICS